MDLKKVWENVLLETQGTVSAMTYDNWLSKTEAVCIADDELLVSADSDVTVNVVETRYTELLRACTKKVAPKIRNLKFVSPAEKSRYEGGRYISLEELNEDSIVAEEYYTNFVPKYTFDSSIGIKKARTEDELKGGGGKSRSKIQSAFSVRRSGTGKNSPYARNREFSQKERPDAQMHVYVKRKVYQRPD